MLQIFQDGAQFMISIKWYLKDDLDKFIYFINENKVIEFFSHTEILTKLGDMKISLTLE